MRRVLLTPDEFRKLIKEGALCSKGHVIGNDGKCFECHKDESSGLLVKRYFRRNKMQVTAWEKK